MSNDEKAVGVCYRFECAQSDEKFVKAYKKQLIFIGIALGLSAVLGITSRLSVGFSEWYAVNIYPLFVGSIGRIFGIFPFSVIEILIILVVAGTLAVITLCIVLIFKGKHVFARTMITLACVLSGGLLFFLMTCGINYNRHLFLRGIDMSIERTNPELEEMMVFLTLLDEFYKTFPDLDGLNLNEDGVFALSGDLHKTAPAAMRNLSGQFPRLNVYYPRPKPASIFSGFLSDAFILGFFTPVTMEANYNRLPNDTQVAITALHELAHVAGFMRENEANFIAFLAARESGDTELMYTAYLYGFDRIINRNNEALCRDAFYSLPEKFRDMYGEFIALIWEDWDWQAELENGGGVYKVDLLPRQVRRDLWSQGQFWFERYYNITYDEDGEVLDMTVNPVVEAISDATSAANDAFLKIQGESDGVESYGRVVDMIIAWYLREMQEMY
jgi:hypothetical protein